MTPTLGALFDRAATTYDAERKLLVPGFDAFYGAAVDAAGPLATGATVLDVGAGTGLFAALLAARSPQINFTLFDIAPAMLEKARDRFAAMGLQPPKIITDDTARGLPEGPYDAVISALSIHHLSDADKQRAYGAIADALRPGGVFVNAEQIAGETPQADEDLDREWEAEVIRLGASPQTIAAARRRMAHDRCAPVATQLDWLAKAGFSEISCPWRGGRFAVLRANLCPPDR